MLISTIDRKRNFKSFTPNYSVFPTPVYHLPSIISSPALHLHPSCTFCPALTALHVFALFYLLSWTQCLIALCLTTDVKPKHLFGPLIILYIYIYTTCMLTFTHQTSWNILEPVNTNHLMMHQWLLLLRFLVLNALSSLLLGLSSDGWLPGRTEVCLRSDRSRPVMTYRITFYCFEPIRYSRRGEKHVTFTHSHKSVKEANEWRRPEPSSSIEIGGI